MPEFKSESVLGQNAEQLQENGWLMLRSYARASPSGARAHRIPICYCTNCMYCTVLYLLYCILYILT